LPSLYSPLPEGAVGASHSFALKHLLALSSAFLVVGLGCVSATEYRKVADDLNGLRQQDAAQEDQIARLLTQEKNLSQELAQSLESFEDLRMEHEALEQRADRLQASELKLSRKLREQSDRLEKTRSSLSAAKGEVNRLASTYTTLMADLESEVSAGQIEIEQLREGVRVSVSDEIIFASGSAELDPIGRKVLDKVSQQLLALDHSIEVQGHTDDLALKASLVERFPSNWELAAARAARVVRLMQEKGIDGERLRVVSFASYQPLVPNADSESRAQNRRIEIRLKPRSAGKESSVSATPDTAGGK
jgi:chemotaxis protein MotB